MGEKKRSLLQSLADDHLATSVVSTRRADVVGLYAGTAVAAVHELHDGQPLLRALLVTP